jgi:hypothetical protein
MQRYAVKKTDTPQRIAARFYHDWTLYKIIVDANKALHDNNSFPVGSVILIPTLFTDDKEHIIELGDRYTSLSLLYYDSESYDRKIKFTNECIILS